MDFKIKSAILDQIYEIYDNFICSIDVACEKHCSICCTRNVAITSLEGYKIFKNIELNGNQYLLEKIKTESEKKRFIPKVTTNMLAAICVDGNDIPDEEINHYWGKCPFLQDNICPIYEARPFGCRCFVSKQSCAAKGYAEIDPFIITVNNLFLQYIEHIDQLGYYGNLTDIIQYIVLRKNKLSGTEIKKNRLKEQLLQNHPITAFLIPHEHKEQIQSLLNSLNSIKVPAGMMVTRN